MLPIKNEHKATLTLCKHQDTKQRVSLSPICMLLSHCLCFGLLLADGPESCEHVYLSVCVSCHSTLLSRHAALLLPQYACSRIPAPLFIFSSPHHNLTLSLCLLVMDLLALLPPSLRWNTNPAEAEKGCAISWMSVVCVSVCKCVYGGGNTHTWPRLYSVSNTW